MAWGVLGALDMGGWGELVPVAVIGVGVLILLYASIRWMRGKGRLTPDQAQRKALSTREYDDVRTNLERLLVDLQELSRQISAHIDTKFCKLEVLIKQADERIRRLETLNGRTGSADAPAGSLAPSTDGPSAPPPRPEPVSTEHEVIYRLADTGKSAVDIAKMLKKHPGEVELILSLRRSRPGGGSVDYRIG